jgi:hypothetical protein
MRKISLKPESAQDDEVIVEVTQEQYQAALARGLEPEETLAPGTHKFIRGGFLKRHPNFDPATVKTTIYIRLGLDQEVLEYFKQLAEQTGADSYETPIKQALRGAMEKGKQTTAGLALDAQAALLDNPQFIEAVAERVKKTMSKKAASKKASQSAKTRRRAA